MNKKEPGMSTTRKRNEPSFPDLPYLSLLKLARGLSVGNMGGTFLYFIFI